MKSLMFLFCVWIVATTSYAQPINRVISARSFSGQFIAQEMKDRVHWSPSPAANRVPLGGGVGFLLEAPPVSPTAPADMIPLEPALLVVSCERMKELFLTELGLNDEWRGRIDLIINKSLADDHRPSLTAIHSMDGWSYELELPKHIKPEHLLTAVIQTLLTELVNRNAAGRAADIPYWLVDGFSAHLRAFNLPTFIIRPNVQSAGYQKLSIQGMETVRTELRDHPALSFQQLSWPDQSDATGKNATLYQSCAQLLFESLLNLKDGPVSFRKMLGEMPKHMNWQTAFILGFHAHFASLLDVEKWWGLTCVTFASADLTGPRTAQECWHRLQEALDVPVEIRMSPKLAPAPARITLQEAIEQWDSSNSLAAVQRAANNLQSLQWFNYQCDLNVDAAGAASATLSEARRKEALQQRITMELSPLVVRYRTVLLSYLTQFENAGIKAIEGKSHSVKTVALMRDTIRQLDALDKAREEIRTKLLFVSAGSDMNVLEAQAANGQRKKARSAP
jgi:hypothetical protein